MHKITKGLKKKKKGKKSKHKEEELFKPEELEAYRREHQQVNETSEEASASAENEEWKKFNALTAGIDTILKKTQGDLDRIKSTSFFQRVPPPSEVKKKKEEERIRVAELEQQKQEEKKPESFAPEAAIVQVSESESEDEEEDDIFDTGYIDAIASGEVKLVHIPDSPQEELEGDDPFDTSIAERAILGPSVDKRGKKLVPIGSAVEILTGRVQAPTCVAIKRPSTRRQIEKEKNLLLQTFDENSNATQEIKVHDTSSQNKVTLLDDDAPSDLLNTPIDLSQNLQLQLATTPVHKEAQEAPPTQFNILEEFDNAAKKAAEDDEDDEFALLAAESLNKKAVVNAVPVRSECGFGFGTEKESWSAFGEAKTSDQIDDEFIIEDDPFDTTFAENILPGKAELKIIEDEILNTTEEAIQNKVRIQIVNPVGQQESFTVGDRVSEQRLNLIQPHHRDLLGGSSTDLSKLGDQPLQPKETVDQDYIEYCDPFDTSLVETAKLPGQTELKFLERELLGEIKQSLNDDTDFNPRIDEDSTERQQNRKVSFDLPLDQHQNLLETGVKIAKPLTPYYIRENSIPEIEEIVDPFDTSFVCEVAPGKAELKLIENELFEKDTILDSNFDPRDDKQVAVAKVVETIQGIANPAGLNTEKKVIKTLDLLVDDHDVQAKVLTPATEKAGFDDYVDPFDTSIACNILPGKTELKLIESELINQEPPKIYNLDAVLKTKLVEEKDFFEENDQTDVNVKTLTPILDRKSDLDSDIDPFDTSIASNIGLGANPFLFTEDDYVSPNSANSNPFLLANDDDFAEDIAGINDNPFLSQNATTMASSNNSTNPFAFDPMDFGPMEAQSADVSEDQTTFMGNTFIDASAKTTTAEDLFTSSPVEDFFGETLPPVPPQKPTDLDLKFTTTNNDNFAALNEDLTNQIEPQKMPPPRPPPSKETQDLLMSVMGAMDATSSHLLDRIPPTRTPSPVSMRDLHSPSPTPEPLGDLLDVSDNTKPVQPNQVSAANIMSMQSNIIPTQSIQPSEDLLMSLDQKNDINENPATVEKPKPPPPQRPSPPVRPPRPNLPPPKPVPPQIPPQKPPPLPPNLNKPQLLNEVNEMMDMFGADEVPQIQKTVASTTDIMNLYNAPVMAAADLLCDTGETAMDTTQTMMIDTTFESTIQDMNVNNASSTAESTPTPTPQPIIQDNFVSPEPSQSDLQMDTSDSQSKGSVSSVTFNPFAVTEDNNISPVRPNDMIESAETENVFRDKIPTDIFEVPPTTPSAPIPQHISNIKQDDSFDAFAMKFESVAQDENKNGGGFDAFDGNNVVTDTWGVTATAGNAFNDAVSGFNDASGGFGPDESFDAFLALQHPPAEAKTAGNRFIQAGSMDSDEDKDFSVIIRPKAADETANEILPTIAPPPTAAQNAFNDSSPRFNPFDQSETALSAIQDEPGLQFDETKVKRTDSQETPPTPLFDEDVSQPLEPFPRIHYAGEGWEMQLRQPNKKKITGQRFWKKIFVRIVVQPDCTLLQLFNQQTDKDPFQELPLQPCYSVSDIGAQQYDNYGKIFTLKLQYIFYKERPGVRPGQVKKAERITNKLSQFAAYAIQGDYQGVKEFGSDLKKLGLPVEHAPQVSQLMKLGSLNYEDLKQFSVCIEEALFKLQAHRDRALHYKMEEVQISVVDELYVEQDMEGHVERQIARVRMFFLGFLTGMPDVELGINDLRRQGREVVGRHDIIPVVTEEWIRLEEVEFHSCVQQDEYEKSHIIRFKPPDACYIELMRFRIRPPKNRELPLQLKPTICISGNRIELRADVLVPGFASRKLGQVPCEDVMIRFPIPECWIYLFRVEKHFRYGSVKSAHRRTGKIKGIERILGTMDTLQESLIEVTSGQAKYEHQHRAIVWRCPRLPKEGQGAYTTHNMVCRLALTSYDQMPEQLAEYCYVEFTMPATQASHTTARSVSFQNSDSDEPPEKYVRYLARHEYK
ncbi:ap complex subunit mu [Holotrichia oblita]|uniref:Ap complex subunit mu n=1 Tax=Holotrichia oblita TaxID=644536 RepID=A0ACB9TBA0_HOLOL|nr:ap complex subunit mu [Holotrichia oblita]